MKLGLIARSEDRGLGIQTWEAFLHLNPDRTLLVDMGELARGFETHPDRFPGATVVPFDGGEFPPAVVQEWLDGLDVVFTAETFYDWRLVEWARRAGVATVCQVNPEFYRHAADPHLPHPTAWWAPTPWLLDRLPGGTRVVPVPVASDRFTMRRPERDGDLRVLHVVGHRAAADRNGTLQLLQALRTVRQPMTVTVRTQGSRLPRTRLTRSKARLVEDTGGQANYWDLYGGADVLAMPRRYGGLCLPVQEAMASGLAVAMTDCPPNDFWPTVPLHARPNGYMKTGLGRMVFESADPSALASVLDVLAADPDEVADQQTQSLAWATRHTWDALRGPYLDALADVAARA